MISRGFFVGEIIDEFSVISSQVKLRNQLGLNDLTVYAENYIKEVLNCLLNINLINLNSERANVPGLDLGDEIAKKCFQVTSTATSEKVNKTLEKITDEQAKKYDEVVVLIIGKKQSSYSLKEPNATDYNFTESNIWDMDDLARKAISLDIDRLEKLHNIVRKHSVKLQIELEIPDKEGNYQTTGYSQWQERPKPVMGDGKRFCSYYEQMTQEALSEVEIQTTIEKLAKELATLPRITREFLAILLERCEPGEPKRNRNWEVPFLLLPKIKREYHGSDFDGELSILEHAGFLDIDGEDISEMGPPEIFITISDNKDFRSMFTSFVEASSLSFRTVIGEVNFSNF